MVENILEVNNLTTVYNAADSVHEILKGISFKIKKGIITRFIGQSRSGKTVTAMSIINMLPKELSIKAGVIRLNLTFRMLIID